MLLTLALVSIYPRIPTRGLDYQFRLFDGPRSELDLDACHNLTHILGYLADFLYNPKRSQEFCAGPKLSAQAAKYCLVYLCDHTASEQRAPPRMSAEQRMRRRYFPWKWHRRVIREDIRGPHVTPWFWLQRPAHFGSFFQPCIFHREITDLIYVHTPPPYRSSQVLHTKTTKLLGADSTLRSIISHFDISTTSSLGQRS